MRILERVQAFLPLLTIEIFYILPPSYVVTKLTYSHRFLKLKDFLAMRILERVQAFLPLLTIEIFLIFPPSYVVTKLSYSQGAPMRKRSY